MKTLLPPSLRLDLAGLWHLSDLAGRATCTLTLPGDVHSALLAAGLIPDPYFGLNEEAIQWVGEAEWNLEREFFLDATLLEAPSVYLHADALDTFCEVTLNGQVIGAADNRFRRWRWEVRRFLVAGSNGLTLRFRSAPAEMRQRAAALPYPVPFSVHGQKVPHWNLVRKPMCHAGWDWGIALQSIGVPGALELRATHTARVEHVCTRQEFGADGDCRLHLAVEVHAPAAVEAVEWEAELDGQIHHATTGPLPAGGSVLETSFRVSNPRCWWPAGYGDQPLYTLRVRVGDETVTKRLGLRELVVENSPEPDGGRPLTLRVNGVDVFAKGANWIPADALPARQTPAATRALLESARAANMNTLRVWGGGQFEADHFYETCDELGLLLWHDFMFSCALYPADPAFLEEVRRETTYQVKRLRDHPSVALWCGDNECVGALTWFEESRTNRDRYLLDWARLDAVRGEAARAADPTHTYWPSSPCAGPGDFTDTWHADGKGDMHFWSVWHEGRSFDAYGEVIPRFCSEFGYQSFPSLATVRTYCPPEDWNLTSPTMEFHQRNDAGNRRILEMFARYFRMPAGFEQALYLSQVQQAVAIKTAVEGWRAARPRCMGALYWQLNDVWPVASWSSLEYGGRWKALHHHARRFYQPVIACVRTSRDAADDRVELRVVNDLPAAGQVTLTAEVWSFAGSLRWTEAMIVAVAPGSSALARTWELSALTAVAGGAAEGFLHVTLSGEVGGSARSHENTYWFTEFKRCRLAPADVRASVQADTLTLVTDAPAFFVEVQEEGGRFDDNSFTLLPGRPRTLRFTPGATAMPPKARVTHLAQIGSALPPREEGPTP